MEGGRKPLDWIGSSKKDLGDFPREVKLSLGYSLHLAQMGDKSGDTKPLRGFGGASVLEVIEDHDGDTYRAVYTVRFEEAIYVLHCFQKKAKSGVETPKQDIDKIKSRLKLAEERHTKWLEKRKMK